MYIFFTISVKIKKKKKKLGIFRDGPEDPSSV